MSTLHFYSHEQETLALVGECSIPLDDGEDPGVRSAYLHCQHQLKGSKKENVQNTEEPERSRTLQEPGPQNQLGLGLKWAHRSQGACMCLT